MPPAAAYSSVFVAIADPTRRAILDVLREGQASAGSLRERVVRGVRAMSQPAFSQHLSVLRKAGLVAAERRGTTLLYRLNPRPLAEVFDWAAHYDEFWNNKLDALDRHLRRNASAGTPARATENDQ